MIDLFFRCDKTIRTVTTVHYQPCNCPCYSTLFVKVTRDLIVDRENILVDYYNSYIDKS